MYYLLHEGADITSPIARSKKKLFVGTAARLKTAKKTYHTPKEYDTFFVCRKKVGEQPRNAGLLKAPLPFLINPITSQ